MAPTILPSLRGRHAAAPIAISTSSSSSSGSDQSDDDAPSKKTLVVLSSSSSSAVSVRSVIAVPSSSGSRPRSAARHRRPPSSCAAVSARSPAVTGPAPSASAGGSDEATSRRKRKARYRCWALQDELKVLATMAKLRRDNLGTLPQASVLFKTLCGGGRALIGRRGVDVMELSQKVYQLKVKFMVAAKVAATGGRRHLRPYRNRVLYEKSKKVWPDLLPDAAAVHQEAEPASIKPRRQRLHLN